MVAIDSSWEGSESLVSDHAVAPALPFAGGGGRPTTGFRIEGSWSRVTDLSDPRHMLSASTVRSAAVADPIGAALAQQAAEFATAQAAARRGIPAGAGRTPAKLGAAGLRSLRYSWVADDVAREAALAQQRALAPGEWAGASAILGSARDIVARDGHDAAGRMAGLHLAAQRPTPAAQEVHAARFARRGGGALRAEDPLLRFEVTPRRVASVAGQVEDAWGRESPLQLGSVAAPGSVLSSGRSSPFRWESSELSSGRREYREPTPRVHSGGPLAPRPMMMPPLLPPLRATGRLFESEEPFSSSASSSAAATVPGAAVTPIVAGRASTRRALAAPPRAVHTAAGEALEDTLSAGRVRDVALVSLDSSRLLDDSIVSDAPFGSASDAMMMMMMMDSVSGDESGDASPIAEGVGLVDRTAVIEGQERVATVFRQPSGAVRSTPFAKSSPPGRAEEIGSKPLRMRVVVMDPSRDGDASTLAPEQRASVSEFLPAGWAFADSHGVVRSLGLDRAELAARTDESGPVVIIVDARGRILGPREAGVTVLDLARDVPHECPWLSRLHAVARTPVLDALRL